jgi:hypothetical protein
MRLILIAMAALIITACGGDSSSSAQSTPLAPTNPQPGPIPIVPSWIGDQTLLSCSGPRGCRDFKLGDTFSGRGWIVERSDSTVVLWHMDADMIFRGPMDGRRFVATYPTGPSQYPNQSRLEGEFAPDGNSFEAVETYFFAEFADGSRSDWQWRVSRR